MPARDRDLAGRMVDLLDATSSLDDARDRARLLVALFAESVGARRVSLQVLIPELDSFATLGVLGHEHFSSTLLMPARSSGLVPVLNGSEPLWTRSQRESHELVHRLLSGADDRVPPLVECPPHLLAAPLRTPQRLRGWVMLSSGPDGFRLADVALTGMLARFAGNVLAPAMHATIFDVSGRITSHPLTLMPASEEPAPSAPVPASPTGSTRLTTRQLEVLAAIADGATAPQIASDLGLSIHTVRTHRRNLMAHFDTHTSTAMIARARAAGILAS